MKNKISTIMAFGLALVTNQFSHAYWCGDCCGGILYGAASGAIDWHNDLKTSNDTFIRDEFEFKTGWGAAASIGALFPMCSDWDMRFELEYVYRRNKLRNLQVDIADIIEFSVPVSGHNRDSAAMANYLIDVGLGCGFYLYYGAGIGVSWNEIEVNFAGASDLNETSRDALFAWQILAGLSYFIYYNIELTAGYRLFATTRPGGFVKTDIEFNRVPYQNCIDLGIRIRM